MKCNKCGKPQQRDEEKSNANWSAYNFNQKCDCGGEFVMFFDGEPLEE